MHGEEVLKVSWGWLNASKLLLLLNILRLSMVNQFRALRLVLTFHSLFQKKVNYLVGVKLKWVNLDLESKEKLESLKKFQS